MTGIIEIWQEGYMHTGQHGKAKLAGCYVAGSFEEAVESWLLAHPEKRWLYEKKKGISGNTEHWIWISRLYDNEAAARKEFG